MTDQQKCKKNELKVDEKIKMIERFIREIEPRIQKWSEDELDMYNFEKENE